MLRANLIAGIISDFKIGVIKMFIVFFLCIVLNLVVRVKIKLN